MSSRRRFLAAGLALAVLAPAVAAAVKIDRVIDLRTESRAGSFALLFCSRKNAGAGPDVGHAFVVWVAEDPERCFSSAEAFGYYPQRDDAAGIVRAVVGPVPGELRREMAEGRIVTSILKVKVDEAAYRASERARERWISGHRYQLLVSDCESFMMEVARSAGLKVPPRWAAPTPHAFLEQLISLNGATAPGPAGNGRGPGASDDSGKPGESTAYGELAQGALARTTMDRMKALGLALESYHARHGRFPPMSPATGGEPATPVASILDDLREMGVPDLSGKDGWGNPILWNQDGDQYGLYSPGAGGKAESRLRCIGPSESWNTDIMYANGRFLTWPCDVPDPPDPDMPCFVMDTASAGVYSIKRSLKPRQPSEMANAGASVGAGAVDLLSGFAQNVIVDGAQAAGPNPWLAAATVLVTYLQRKADQLFDPVTILPIGLGLSLPKDGLDLEISSSGHKAVVMPVVVLDFLKLRSHGNPVDLSRYADGLGMSVRGQFLPNELLDHWELLTRQQLRSLRADRNYVVIPKRPLDLRGYTNRCRKCRYADGRYGLVVSAGARYGAYGRPGTTHEDSVVLRVTEKSGVAPSGKRMVEPAAGMAFRYIPAGEFEMGSPKSEPGRDDDERQHRVRITRGYWMGETEVTQGQYRALTGKNPSEFKRCGDDCPVEQVSWYDAVRYANALSRKAGLVPCYEISGNTVGFKGLDCEGYRLPTEAEWEYGARAGTTGPFWTGRCLGTDRANYDGNYPLEGCSKGKYREHPVRVRSFAANGWGLYEVAGNVWEWVWDWYGEYPYGTVTDPLGPSRGSYRVERGGSWDSNAGYCRSARRLIFDPGGRGSDLGFRLARTAR